jgi:hypothetical protein
LISFALNKLGLIYIVTSFFPRPKSFLILRWLLLGSNSFI